MRWEERGGGVGGHMGKVGGGEEVRLKRRRRTCDSEYSLVLMGLGVSVCVSVCS